MANFYSNLHLQTTQKDVMPANASQRLRQVYISPYKDQREHGQCSTSPGRFIKVDSHPSSQALPPKAAPFRRSSRHSSKDRVDQTRERSGQIRPLKNMNESMERRENSPKLASLKKELVQERTERERLKAMCCSQQQKIKMLADELAKSREERQALHGELLTLRGQLEQTERGLSKSNEQIDSLSKSLKESKINQKSLANLKNLQMQLQLLQQRNSTLTKQMEQQAKNNKKMKGDLLRKKECTSQSEYDTTKKQEKIKSLEMEIKRLKEQLAKDRSQRQVLLQANLHTLERKLFDKQSEIKRISIQLNCLDRKKYISIDQVKAKKDQQIKQLRHRFNKVNRDLKETRTKIEQNQKRRIPKEKSPFVRKIKSSQLLGGASESEEVTFEFSSEA